MKKTLILICFGLHALSASAQVGSFEEEVGRYVWIGMAIHHDGDTTYEDVTFKKNIMLRVQRHEDHVDSTEVEYTPISVNKDYFKLKKKLSFYKKCEFMHLILVNNTELHLYVSDEKDFENYGQGHAVLFRGGKHE